MTNTDSVNRPLGQGSVSRGDLVELNSSVVPSTFLAGSFFKPWPQSQSTLIPQQELVIHAILENALVW